jgi:hypothetical protein
MHILANIYYHKSLQEPTLFGISNTRISQIHVSVILLLPMWRYRYERFSTHTLHTHTQYTVTPSPAALLHCVKSRPHTDSLWPNISLPLHSQLRLDVYTFIRLRCVWVMQYPGYVGGLACGIHHTTLPRAETAAPSGNPETVPAVRS